MRLRIITDFGKRDFDVSAQALEEIFDAAKNADQDPDKNWFEDEEDEEVQEEPEEDPEEEEVEDPEETVVQEVQEGAEETGPEDFSITGRECLKRRHRRVDSLFGDFRAGKDEGNVGEKGFMLIKCESCGEIRSFFSRKRITYNRCQCGCYTDLYNLKPAYQKCQCGKEFKYMTNLTDDTISGRCVECGRTVTMQINSRGTAYVTRGGGRRS